MAEPTQSTVFWHSDGYIEVALAGVQTPEQIQELNKMAVALLEGHDSVNLLIDARIGRIGRDAASFSALMKLARDRRLKKFYILVDRNPTHPNAGKESGVIVSMLTAALGKRPYYYYDETEVRTLATE
jgi:hypothetical protein